MHFIHIPEIFTDQVYYLTSSPVLVLSFSGIVPQMTYFLVSRYFETGFFYKSISSGFFIKLFLQTSPLLFFKLIFVLLVLQYLISPHILWFSLSAAAAP